MHTFILSHIHHVHPLSKKDAPYLALFARMAARHGIPGVADPSLIGCAAPVGVPAAPGAGLPSLREGLLLYLNPNSLTRLTRFTMHAVYVVPYIQWTSLVRS